MTHTPWGTAQTAEHKGRGIVFYTTSSHGGFHVSPKLNATMPDSLRIEDGWYEEDCDWSLVVMAFCERFTAEEFGQAFETFKNWHPKRFEEYYQCNPGLVTAVDETISL